MLYAGKEGSDHARKRRADLLGIVFTHSGGHRAAAGAVRLLGRAAESPGRADPATVVLDGQGQPITLAESYAAAGPARAGNLLAATLGIQLDRYLAATPAVWGQSLSGLGQARVNLSPLLDEAQRRALGVAAVAQLDAAEAANLLQGTDLTGPPLGRLRAAVWQAFALQSQGSLAEAVPQGLRRCSGDLLTDLTALDLEELGRVLAQLADASCSPQADLLPGHWDERTARYELEEDALTLAQALFPLAPQEAETN